MSNHENEIQFESYLNDVKETVDTPSDDIRDSVISESLGGLRSRIGKLNIEVNTDLNKEVKEEKAPHYQGTELAETAVNIYKTRVKKAPAGANKVPDVKRVTEGCGCDEKEEKKGSRETINSKAARENTKATIRSLMGMRGSGDDGKRAPNANMSGSGSTGGYGPSSVVVPPLSMEDYRAQIFKDFGLVQEEQSYEAIQEITEETEELDLVSELETNLLEMADRSWIEVDRTTRQLCIEHGVLVKDINKEFRSRHGVFPDKWIKEQVELEQCGWVPLDEVTRVSKIGEVYDVTFMYRGGTQRFKFFWPEVSRPSRDDMQKAVEKFYPKARLITYYPCRDQGDNYMVMVPPMTENYEITPEDNWVEMTEDQQAVYDLICEEEGEPTSFPFIEEDGSIVLYIEDHDTGDEREVIIEKRDGKSAKDKGYTLRDWFKGGGWKQTGGKHDGKPCAKQPGQTTKPYCRDADDRAAMSKDERNKRAAKKRKEDPNADRSGKAINVRQESAELEELKCWKGYKRKRGAVPGTKGSCVKEGNEMKGMSQKSGDKRSTESGAGMTAKGVAKYNSRTGGNLKTAVTTPPSKLKPGSKAAGRRKSFCARSRGWTGERGKAARRRWNC